MALDHRGHINGVYWYSEQKQLAFFAVPKNASTALRNSMGPTDARYYFDSETKLSEQAVKFSVLRNPIDRCVSAYIEVIKRVTVDCLETIRKPFYKIPEGKARFVGFLDEIETRGFWENHAQPQTFYLSNNQEELIDLDYIFIFEKLREGLDKMAEETGKNLTPKREWFHSPEHKQMVHSYLDEDIKSRIKQIYKKDWDLYEKALLRT